MAFVSVDDVTKRFGRRVALDGLSLEVEKGDAVAVFGANGAGKTTLLRVLASLSRPTSGTVAVDGVEHGGANPDVRSRLGLVSHDDMLYDDMTAVENLRIHARLHAVDASACDERLRTVGLSDWSNERVSRFSHGMRKRLSLARALLHDPELLLLDEPFSGLDQTSAETVVSVITSDDDRTVVAATHDIEHGEYLADRAVFLDDGHLVGDVRPDGSLEETYMGVLGKEA